MYQYGISINELCDKLSVISVGTHDTYGKVKHYTMELGCHVEIMEKNIYIYII
jgi:hypothetical protein